MASIDVLSDKAPDGDQVCQGCGQACDPERRLRDIAHLPARRWWLTDGEGHFLKLLVEGGSHGWRIDYSFSGMPNTLSPCASQNVGLPDARRKDGEVRKKVGNGVDPNAPREEQRRQKRHASVLTPRAPKGGLRLWDRSELSL